MLTYQKSFLDRIDKAEAKPIKDRVDKYNAGDKLFFVTLIRKVAIKGVNPPKIAKAKL